MILRKNGEKKMLIYESNILQLAELEEPYVIKSDFIEVEMEDIPLEVRTHRLIAEG